MRLLVYILLFSAVKFSFAQVTMEQSLYSNMGGSVNFQGWQMDFSVGEPVIQTVSSNGITFTQGFHQPLDSFSIFDDPFRVSFSVQNTCRGKTNGSIAVSVTGGFAPYYIYWNDLANDSTTFYREGLPVGTYTAQVSDSLGNIDTLAVTIGETDDCLKIYTGITPNGDGANDYWYLGNIEFYPDNEVQLYSRWGNIVWETKAYDNVANYWNGTDRSGRRLPDGTYFYIIQNAGSKIYKGWVELTGDVR